MLTHRPEDLYCEVVSHHLRIPATHIYGPECEAETGKLMYLCANHAKRMAYWIASHPNRPVECPTHGIIGVVKNATILTALPKA